MSKQSASTPLPTLAPYQQEQAATLIRSVRARLLADDPDLWRDMFDGESDAIDLIRSLIRASIDADLLAEATRQRDRRKIGGAAASWLSSRSFSGRGWMRGLDVEVGEDRG